MRLLSRYNRVTLVTTVVVMLITGFIYYIAINLILINDVDKDLEVEENEVIEYARQNNRLPQVFESNDQQISFYKAEAESVKRHFLDTLYKVTPNPAHRRHHHNGERYESGRGLVTSVSAGGQYYKVLIVKSTVETEDLVKIIFFITIGVVLLLLLTLFIINRLLLNRLWQPFHALLKELRIFNVADNKDIPRIDTSIDEFKELNQAVTSMSSRVKSDYKDLKTFTENASHELLTPIAVINSKLDSLLQTGDFSQQQSKLLNDLYSAVARLARLNQSMLLLVKIENRLLEEKQNVNLKPTIEELIIQFEEIFHDKELIVDVKLIDKELHASPYLLDILLNNLLGNAIRHNHFSGKIIILLNKQELEIKNTGGNASLQQDLIFKRFHKSSESDGSGLGLTISKQICENLGFKLSYLFDAGYHTFTVTF
ncbi:MAG TPA: HAMP domain-containing sensor histidine kinase [Mucilaginibacter sp.]|nr:HAMP domain-containing sensor histidine kinase [Mucilaginibacter sp.]